MTIKSCILITGLLITALGAEAQVQSRLGRFRVDQNKGCAPFTITVTILAPFKCDGTNPCDMDFEGNNQFKSLTFTYTYNQPGTYTLKILFQTSGFDDVPVTVTPNIQPQFDVYTCGNNAVSVNITDTNYNQYVINYNDGSPVVVVPAGSGAKDQHTYASSGNKTITVRGRNLSSGDNCNPASKNVTALAALPAPSITLLTVTDPSTIRIDYNGQPDIQYKLEIAANQSSSFQLFKTSYNVTSEILTNLKPDDNYYCFRIGAFDPCNNTTVYSSTVCSANLDLAVQNNSNHVTWATNSAGVSGFRLARTENGGNNFTTTVTGSSYDDTSIRCGTNYCYQLTTVYPDNARSVSLQKCGTAVSTNTPLPVENITAIVGQPGVDLQWQPVAGFTATEYSVYKSSGDAYAFMATAATTQWRDNTYRTEDGSCYRISYKDICNNLSQLSVEVCPIQLVGSLTKENEVTLSWAAYSGWKDGAIQYQVEKYSASGQLLETTFTIPTTLTDDTQDPDNQVVVYVVKAIPSEGGLPQAVSNTITIIKNPNLFSPTGFTPNGDNLNDIFNVFGQYVTAFEMNIFNRWGELMFTTTSLDDGWDGNYKGHPMPEGTYTFVATITDKAGRSFKKSGSVLLLRKGQ